jgi:hypothetical protein
VPRKRHKRQRRSHTPPPPARFEVGAAVRVRPGTCDPDYPDIPLGGWAGTVKEIRQSRGATAYLVGLNQHTLDQMPPIYVQRCERDDLEHDEIWLRDEDLEPDAGRPVPIERPVALVPRPLRQADADDRIRAVFGLTSDDPVPPATKENLRTYHRHLATRLKFPFQAICLEEGGPPVVSASIVSVVGLVDPGESDLADGLLCTVKDGEQAIDVPLVDVRPTRSARAADLLADYAYWFFEGSVAEGRPDAADDQSPRQVVWWWLWRLALAGAVVGAAVAAVPGADIGAGIGAFIGGLLGALLGINHDRILGATRTAEYGSLAGGLAGGLTGAALSAPLGAMVPAYPGALGGVVLGAAVGWVWRRRAAKKEGVRTMAILGGAALGALGWAFYCDAVRALWGALFGLVGGAAGVPLVAFGALMLIGWFMRRTGR